MSTNDKTDFLLTGASGFLGSILYKSLHGAGYSISLLSRNKDALYNFDLLDNDLRITGDIKTVIHCAGKAHSIPKNDKEIKEFFDVNFLGTKKLCEAFSKDGKLPMSFIFISSVAVYGIDMGMLIAEDHPLNGKTPYAKSKILAEEFLLNWGEKNNVKIGILRLPLIAGPNPPGNLNSMIKGIKSGRYLSIGNAEARKSVVWAEDIANFIPVLAEKGGVYNLTDGYHPSFGELESGISKIFNKRKPIGIPIYIAWMIGKIGDLLGPRSPINSDKLNKITSTLTFDDRKARTSLGWKSVRVIDKLSEILLMEE